MRPATFAQAEQRPERRPVSQILRALGWRYVIRTGVYTALVFAVIGVPTDVVPNPWFTRMTPVRHLDYWVLALSSILTGAILASSSTGSWFGSGASRPAGAAGGVLGWLAIGCPICNKLIVGVLGVSGALNFFAPIQPALGLLAIGLGTTGLALRLRSLRGECVSVPGLADKCQLIAEPTE